MAKILKSFQFATSAARSKHDWNAYLDGRIHQLSQEDVGETKLATIGSLARTQAAKRGLGIRVNLDEDAGSITFQTYESPEAQQRLANKKAEKAAEKAAAKAAKGNGEPAAPTAGAPAPAPKAPPAPAPKKK